jgi:Na+-translocating ferredoxin:NAD+ oxidoreductase RnfD subunit
VKSIRDWPISPWSALLLGRGERPSAPRSVQLWGRTYPVLVPSLADPRLHVAVVIFTLQILGQTVLGFRVSIAQILVCLVTAALIEFVVAFFRDHIVMWPASGLLTGNSVAFILRVPGTVHGQWWSLRGAGIFVLAVAVSMASKYFIRRRGQHIFNPSNLGLVACFLALGPQLTEPQDLWWIGLSPALVLTYAVILVGGVLIGARLKLLAMEIAFLGGFAASLVLSLGLVPDHCITASWASAPLCGRPLWEILVISPEVLVFAFFMLSDPRTVPASPFNRVLFGLAVGFFAALLLGPTGTEFWTKTAILASLVVACAVRFPLARLTRLHWGLRVPAVALAGILCLASLPLSTAIPARNPQLVAWLPGELAPAPVNSQVGAGPGIAAAVAKAATDSLPAPGQAKNAPLAGAASDYVWGVPKLSAVVVPKNVTDFDPGLTPTMASALAYNLAVDLNIEAEARHQLSTNLAATAASGDGLTPFTAAIGSDRAAGHVVTTAYSFSRAELVLLLPKYRTQASRLVGTTLVGTARVTTYDSAGQVLSQTDVPYTQIWELTPAGGRYQITNEYTGLTPAP